jgi:hypothetical protein
VKNVGVPQLLCAFDLLHAEAIVDSHAKPVEELNRRIEKLEEVMSKTMDFIRKDAPLSIYLDLEKRLRPFAEGAFALDRTDITLKDLLNYGGVVIVSYKTSGVDGSVVMGEEMQRLVTWSILEHIHSHMLSQKATEGKE